MYHFFLVISNNATQEITLLFLFNKLTYFSKYINSWRKNRPTKCTN